MGLFNRKPSLKRTGGKVLGVAESDLEQSDEGGPSPFAPELETWRLTHTEQSIDLARSGYDPASWHGSRMLFNLETTLAHAHQELRDRLQVWAHKQIEEASEDLYEDAGEVANAQVRLEAADGDLVRTLDLWRASFEELEDDPQELVRLNSLRSQPAQLLKLLILILFVASEFIITGFIFNKSLPLDIPYIGYILAVGVIVMLIAVPHYLAQGIKEGITQHHRWDLSDDVPANGQVKLKKHRQIHREKQDDAGFKLISAFVGLVLIALVVPLSILRASDTYTGSKVLWFFAFLFIQLAVSGYFFLREWLDHGAPSTNLHRVEGHLDRARRKREDAADDYADALDQYFQDAAPVFKAMTDVLRQDAQIVECYLETLHFGRHLQTIERPELAAFINAAYIPYLGTQTEVDDSRGDHYDPVTSSNRPLEHGGVRGRDWFLNRLDEAMQTAARVQDDDAVSIDRPITGTLLDSMSRDWLYGYLGEHFGLARYTTPVFEPGQSKERTILRAAVGGRNP